MLGAALLGVAGTVLTHSDPGSVLGLCVIAGSVIAAISIRRSRLYVLIPLPALASFFGAVVAGAIHDRGADTSTTEFGVNFLQWIANVFFAMCAATILVLVIAGARWLFSRQFVSGQFAMSAGRADPGPPPRQAARPRPGSARPGSDPRDEIAAGTPKAKRRGPRPDRDVPDDRTGLVNRRLIDDQRDSGPWGTRTGRGDRSSWANPDQQDPRAPRDDRPRPTY